jgi:sialate O-acetylesterase
VFRGILFYQGENNSFGVSWKPYPYTLPLVIEQWRESFGDLPFGIIQIAGWSNRRSMTYDMNHHTNVIREIQFDVWQRTEKSGLIVTYDTNSNQSIHPGAKQPVGDRSARWALGEVYMRKNLDGRQPLSWKGPVFESHEVRDGKLVIGFSEQTRRGLRLDQDDEVGFYIAGEDRVFHHARVRVIREENVEKLLVWSDDVKQPVAARYAWSNLPVGRLMNHLELPAYPFRTDDWPLTPHQSTGDYHRNLGK